MPRLIAIIWKLMLKKTQPSSHMHVAGLVLQESTGRSVGEWFEEMKRRVETVTGGREMSAETAYARASPLNPFMAGGVETSLRDYSLFLSAFVTGRLLDENRSVRRHRRPLAKLVSIM